MAATISGATTLPLRIPAATSAVSSCVVCSQTSVKRVAMSDRMPLV
jgi:hypothetical protein